MLIEKIISVWFEILEGDNMYNVLHVIGHLGQGGDTTVVLEILNKIDKNKYHFDFITHKGADMNTVNAIRKQGCKVYVLPGDVRQMGIIRYYSTIKKILSKYNKYDAIHTHTSMQSGVALLAAKKNGIKNRICHSHVTSIQRGGSILLKALAVPVFRLLYMHASTRRVACSKASGDYLFRNRKKYCLIYNGINVDAYSSVSDDQINALRCELMIDKKDIVIGHVARMNAMKNQLYDLKLAERLKDNKHVKFILVGDGEDYSRVLELSQKGNYQIQCLGRRSDVPIIMNLCDYVILPSLPGEGFPMTMIEAQAAGCKCIVSEKVTSEVDIGLGLLKRIPLDDVSAWTSELSKEKSLKSNGFREMCVKKIIEKGFDNNTFFKKWTELYSDQLN